MPHPAVVVQQAAGHLQLGTTVGSAADVEWCRLADDSTPKTTSDSGNTADKGE
jgi:hypothetical protein